MILGTINVLAAVNLWASWRRARDSYFEMHRALVELHRTLHQRTDVR